jgi:hypothetical protein
MMNAACSEVRHARSPSGVVRKSLSSSALAFPGRAVRLDNSSILKRASDDDPTYNRALSAARHYNPQMQAASTRT